jgi:hypothetical protein
MITLVSIPINHLVHIKPINQTCQIKGSYKQPLWSIPQYNAQSIIHNLSMNNIAKVVHTSWHDHDSFLKFEGEGGFLIVYCLLSKCSHQVPKMFPLGSKSVPQVPIVLPSKMFPIAPHFFNPYCKNMVQLLGM